MDPETAKRSSDLPVVRTEVPMLAGCRYIRDLLQWEDPLSVALRDLPVEDGDIFCYLPTGTKPGSLVDLERSWETLEGRREESIELVADFAHNYLSEGDGRAFFVTSEWRDRDPVLRRLVTPHLVLPGATPQSICLCVQSGASLEAVRIALNEGRAFTLIGVLTRTSMNLNRPGELPILDLAEWVSDTDYLLAEAFDGMTYLIWRHPHVRQRARALVRGTRAVPSI